MFHQSAAECGLHELAMMGAEETMKVMMSIKDHHYHQVDDTDEVGRHYTTKILLYGTPPSSLLKFLMFYMNFRYTW